MIFETERGGNGEAVVINAGRPVKAQRNGHEMRLLRDRAFMYLRHVGFTLKQIQLVNEIIANEGKLSISSICERIKIAERDAGIDNAKARSAQRPTEEDGDTEGI